MSVRCNNVLGVKIACTNVVACADAGALVLLIKKNTNYRICIPEWRFTTLNFFVVTGTQIVYYSVIIGWKNIYIEGYRYLPGTLPVSTYRRSGAPAAGCRSGRSACACDRVSVSVCLFVCLSAPRVTGLGRGKDTHAPHRDHRLSSVRLLVRLSACLSACMPPPTLSHETSLIVIHSVSVISRHYGGHTRTS